MRISDWSSDVCSSDLGRRSARPTYGLGRFAHTAFVGVSRWSRNWHRGGRLRRGDDGVSAWPLSDPLQTARLSLTHLRCAHALLAFHHRYRCRVARSEEHTSELQSLMRISYAVFCLKKKTKIQKIKLKTIRLNYHKRTDKKSNILYVIHEQ